VADEPVEFARRLGRVLEHELVELLRRDTADRLAARLRRFRRVGLEQAADRAGRPGA